MILIPELETVLLLVPRTGSGSLYRAVEKRWPNSMRLYRHMEADGVPFGYDRWRKVGVIRHPVDRMFSMWKFLRAFDQPDYSGFSASNRAQAARPFEDWLINNEVGFANGFDTDSPRYRPPFSVLHPMPENKKSQFIYLRPDLGTELLQFRDITSIERRFEVKLDHHNATPKSDLPFLSMDAWDHIDRFHSWDLKAAHR